MADASTASSEGLYIRRLSLSQPYRRIASTCLPKVLLELVSNPLHQRAALSLEANKCVHECEADDGNPVGQVEFTLLCATFL